MRKMYVFIACIMMLAIACKKQPTELKTESLTEDPVVNSPEMGAPEILYCDRAYSLGYD